MFRQERVGGRRDNWGGDGLAPAGACTSPGGVYQVEGCSGRSAPPGASDQGGVVCVARVTWCVPDPVGASLGLLPDPAVVADLGLPIIPRAEVDAPAALASASLEGDPHVEPAAPLLKAGSSHNPEKGKQPRQGKTQPTEAQAQRSFVLGEGLPPVPAKLVEKIRRGEFVDMAELLRDNIEAERRRGSASDIKSLAQKRREVPDILSWVQCFGAYACVVASQHPERLTQLLAYQTTIIREARRCGGAGWQGYDAMFRQHAANAANPVDWSQLNPSLYAVTFMAQQNGRGRTCEHCLESDHVSAECALAQSQPVQPQPPVRPPPPVGQGPGLGVADSRRPGDTRDPLPMAVARNRGPSRTVVDRVCYSWNDGFCRFQPRCRFRHECARCGGDHRASECPRRPPLGPAVAGKDYPMSVRQCRSRGDCKLRAQQGSPGDASHEESLLPDCPAQHNAAGRTFARAFE